MKTLLVLLIAAVFASPLARGQGAAEVESLLKGLGSDDIETRYDAMFKLQTCLDPRVPDACLAVLKKEGGTIRRWAARAIGSRWWQIPKERVPVFTKALKEHLDSEHDGLPNMSRRGIALLNRDYTGPMVSRSSNKRWVVYERYGLPCLIDTRTMTEELLGFPDETKMMCTHFNAPLAPTVKWHPKKEMVAMKMVAHRKLTTVWVWSHGQALREISDEDLLDALGINRNAIQGGAPVFTELVGWKGDNFEFTMSYTAKDGTDRVATLAWNPAATRVRLVSDQVSRER
jgi:hypothetical protein